MSMKLLPRETLGECRYDLSIRLAPHIRLALDMLNLGILFVSSDGRMLVANRAARGLLQLRRGLFIHNGRLHAEAPRATERLHAQIRAATEAQRGAAHGGAVALALPRSGGRPMMTLILACHGEVMSGGTHPSAILFIDDPAGQPEVNESYLASAYSLTPAETRLLRGLISGKRLAACAREGGITLFTAKGYLKQIFSKTGATRQADLMRLVLADPIMRLTAVQPERP